MKVSFKLQGTFSGFKRIALILYLFSFFILPLILQSFTNCADQAAFYSYGETVHLKICEAKGREKETLFLFQSI
jgi:hypothetical protein